MFKIDAGLAHVLLRESALCSGTVDGGAGEIKAREAKFWVGPQANEVPASTHKPSLVSLETS